MSYSLSLNTNPLVNRYTEPHDLIRTIAKEIKVKNIQLTHEFINPSWPIHVIQSYVREYRTLLSKYNVNITSGMTGPYGRLNHFGHPNKSVQLYYLNWFKTFSNIIGELGGIAIGSQFAILSYSDFDNLKIREDRINRALELWYELAETAKNVGLKYLFWEPMSVGREFGETIQSCLDLQKRIESCNMAIPMLMMADIDHGDIQSSNPKDYDPYSWAELVAHKSPIIHVKQSLNSKSGHFPFTKEYNDKGLIQPQKLLDTIALSGSKTNEICLELSFKEREPTDRAVVNDIAESVRFWSKFVDTGFN